jgi:hypothetical protein
MKKIIIMLFLFCFLSQVNALEIRLNKILSGFNGQVFSIHNIQEIYNTSDSIFLKCKALDKSTLLEISRYFQINNSLDVYEIDEMKFTNAKQDKLEFSLELKYGYRIEINTELVSFEGARPNMYGYNNINAKKGIIPLYFYIKNINNEIVFNFNIWKADKKEFYPEEYMIHATGSKIYYSEGELEKKTKLKASFTQKNLYLINSKGNKIAVVFESFYDDFHQALIIFDVQYNAIINDTRVRLRSEPNLESETLSYFYEGSKVRILDQTDEPYEIDGESYYWYKVESGTYPVGWVYGKYLDIENE